MAICRSFSFPVKSISIFDRATGKAVFSTPYPETISLIYDEFTKEKKMNEEYKPIEKMKKDELIERVKWYENQLEQTRKDNAMRNVEIEHSYERQLRQKMEGINDRLLDIMNAFAFNGKINPDE